MAILGRDGHFFKAVPPLNPSRLQSVSQAFDFTLLPTTARYVDAQIPLTPEAWTTTVNLRLEAVRHCKRMLSNYQHEFIVLEISAPSHSANERKEIRVTVQRDIEEELKTSLTTGIPDDRIMIFPPESGSTEYLCSATTVDEVSWGPLGSPAVADVICLLGTISRTREAYTARYNCFWFCATAMSAIRRIDPLPVAMAWKLDSEGLSTLVISWLRYQLWSTFSGVPVDSGSVAEDAASAIRQFRRNRFNLNPNANPPMP